MNSPATTQRVLRRHQVMTVESASGAKGTLLQDEVGQWFFQRKGEATAMPIWHDDLAFHTRDGQEAMLLSGMGGHFLRPKLVPAHQLARLEVTLERDGLASFYFPADGSLPFLDHDPAVLGLTVLE